jgi:cephalosporin hydroxylase
MNLIDLADNTKTDKNTAHSYLDLYQNLLVGKKDTAKNVLEIGICCGGSIKLWNDFFINANIHALDIMNENEILKIMGEHEIWNYLKKIDKIILYPSTDAYNNDFFVNTFLNKNIKFDILIDDGPHTIDSMIQFVKLYSQIMTDDGILIIEDLPSFDWVDILTESTPEDKKKYIKSYDLRSNKNRHDDILFTIDKFNL